MECSPREAHQEAAFEFPLFRTYVGAHDVFQESRLLQDEVLSIGRRCDSKVLCEIFDKKNASGKPAANIEGSPFARLLQTLPKLNGYRVLLQVIIIQSENRKGRMTTMDAARRILWRNLSDRVIRKVPPDDQKYNGAAILINTAIEH